MKKKQLKNAVLAEGEATGHAHRLPNDVAAVFELEDGVREFELTTDAPLTHEEHAPIQLPASVAFQSDIVREFDFFEQEARKVED